KSGNDRSHRASDAHGTNAFLSFGGSIGTKVTERATGADVPHPILDDVQIPEALPKQHANAVLADRVRMCLRRMNASFSGPLLEPSVNPLRSEIEEPGLRIVLREFDQRTGIEDGICVDVQLVRGRAAAL